MQNLCIPLWTTCPAFILSYSHRCAVRLGVGTLPKSQTKLTTERRRNCNKKKRDAKRDEERWAREHCAIERWAWWWMCPVHSSRISCNKMETTNWWLYGLYRHLNELYSEEWTNEEKTREKNISNLRFQRLNCCRCATPEWAGVPPTTTSTTVDSPSPIKYFGFEIRMPKRTDAVYQLWTSVCVFGVWCALCSLSSREENIHT